MAKTPAQLGMITPSGTDLIRNGDNAITKNAEVTADWIGRLLNGEIEIIELNGGEDLNDFRTPGRYILRTASSAAPILNIPPGMSHNVFYLRVVSHTVGSFQYVMQDWSGLSDAGENVASGYFRRNTSGASGALYIPWRRLDNDFAAAQGGAGIANVLRVQEFKDTFPPINTNGRAAVALRFDHGLANFNSKIRPLLEARNLPYCLALSSRHWGAAENAGVTAAMVNSWNSLCEVWNHGAGNHQDASDIAGLTDMIVTGKTELQAQLPNKKIWGFIPSGVGGTNYGGFNGGNSPEAFYGTMAGQLILENHAVSAGAYPGTAYRPMDGEVRQGMSHAGLETRTVSSLQSLVNTAIADKTGLQLMTHPSRLDEAGYHTTAELTQMLDYIVAKRDAGEIVVLSPYEMMLADAHQEIIVKETAGRTVSVWDYMNNREQLIYGDTGLRNMAGELTNVESAGHVQLNRYGNLCTLIFHDVKTTTSGNTAILTLPIGFRPDISQSGSAIGTTRIQATNNGSFVLLGATVGTVITGSLTWYTPNPWPTTLPGVAA